MSKRIELFDALRGASILLMLVHHLAVDLVGLGILPGRLLYNPVVEVLWFVFASVFILLCGFSSNFAKNNWRRGALLLVCAYALTFVTSFIPGAHIRFGILHLLGFSVLLYAAFGNSLQRVPWKTWFFLFLGAYVGYVLVNAGFWVNPDHLWMLGVVGPGFASADYFPLLPWFLLFMLGTHLGAAAKAGALPEWVYRYRCPALAAIGRHTLIIYLVHQPVFYGVFYLLGLYKF